MPSHDPDLHVQFYDELVDALGALRLDRPIRLSGPTSWIVALQISEGSIIRRHNELIHGLDPRESPLIISNCSQVSPHNCITSRCSIAQVITRADRLGHRTKHIGGLLIDQPPLQRINGHIKIW